MTVSAAKSDGNRLDRSAQWGADRSENRINPAAQAKNLAQLALQMPELPSCRHMKLDQGTNWQQHGTTWGMSGHNALIYRNIFEGECA